MESTFLINSHMRCTTFGLKRNHFLNDSIAPISLVRELKKQNSLFLEEGEKVFNLLANYLSPYQVLILLVDYNGTILDIRGNEDLQEEFKSIQLQVGGDWREERKGTNAIGTCIVEGKPIQVGGDEHFVHRNRLLSCSAAPIYDKDNRLYGVFALANLYDTPFRLSLPLTVMGADSLQTRIQFREHKSQRSASPILGFSRRAEIGKSNEKATILFSDIYSNCPKMDKCLELARKAVSVDENMLFTGESGTGKEMIAQAIHNTGSRKGEPFVVISCSSIQDPESGQLLGVQENQFLEKILEANRGTLFLDEIAELNQKSQSLILRLILEKRVVPYGDTRSIPIDVRIIASTTYPIHRMLKEKIIRSDLFYRLRGIHLDVPSLRERSDTIGLSKHFLKKLDCPEYTISSAAQKKLLTHHWSGNIRELQGVILQAAFLTQETEVGADQIQLLEETPMEREGSYKLSAKGAEKQAILSALNEAKGNVSKAAEILGIGRTTLYRKFKEYDISP